MRMKLWLDMVKKLWRKHFWLRVGVMVFGLVMLDFITKTLVLAQTPFALEYWGDYRKLYPRYFPVCDVIPAMFRIVLVWNNGVSFSMMSNNSEMGRWALVVMALVISAYIVYLLRMEKDKLGRVGFVLIIAGAIGNVVDRIRYGAVVDFLDFYIGDYHWPAFNLADIFICVGVGLVVLASMLEKRKARKIGGEGK